MLKYHLHVPTSLSLIYSLFSQTGCLDKGWKPDNFNYSHPCNYPQLPHYFRPQKQTKLESCNFKCWRIWPRSLYVSSKYATNEEEDHLFRSARFGLNHFLYFTSWIFIFIFNLCTNDVLTNIHFCISCIFYALMSVLDSVYRSEFHNDMHNTHIVCCCIYIYIWVICTAYP